MARTITILERLDYPGGWKANVAYWADVPLAAQAYYANPGAGSQFKDATLAELGAIQDGAVREQVDTVAFPPESVHDQATIDAQLLANQVAWQSAVNAEAAAKLAQYGRYWDGTQWVDPA